MSASSPALRVGIRYCGGCNPRYDRGALVRRLTALHPDWQVRIAAEGVPYDWLLVVGGCPCCCAAYEQFTYAGLKKIWEDVEDIDLPTPAPREN